MVTQVVELAPDEANPGDGPAAPLDSPAMALWGRSLRFVLVAELMDREEMTVAEMVAFLANVGFTVEGRPSKTISDCLRWEVRRGRVERVDRGRYRYRSAPRPTARRIRLFGRRCLEWLRAATSRRPLPSVEPDPRAVPGAAQPQAGDPPWWSFGWLWVR